MQIQFSPVNDILYTLQCTGDVNWTEVLNQAKKQLYIPQPAAQGALEWAVDHAEVIDWLPTDLSKTLSAVRSPQFKKQLLDLLFSNAEFLRIWGHPDLYCFDQITMLDCAMVRTPPQFIDHPWHTDNRGQIAFGMIYLIDGDDARQSTYFASEPEQDEIRIPTGLGQGWLVINHESAVHRGTNHTDQSRYCIKFSLNFRTKKSTH